MLCKIDHLGKSQIQISWLECRGCETLEEAPKRAKDSPSGKAEGGGRRVGRGSGRGAVTQRALPLWEAGSEASSKKERNPLALKWWRGQRYTVGFVSEHEENKALC